MEKHTLYLTQNAFDLLASLTVNEMHQASLRFADTLVKKEGLDEADAVEAAEDAFMEVRQRVVQFRKKSLFQS